MRAEDDRRRLGRTHQDDAQFRDCVGLDDEPAAGIVKAACEGVDRGLSGIQVGEPGPALGIGVERLAVEAAVEVNPHVRNRCAGFSHDPNRHGP